MRRWWPGGSLHAAVGRCTTARHDARCVQRRHLWEPMRRQLDAFRDAYAKRLALYQEIDRSESGLELRDPYAQLTLRYGIARARAAVDWSDAATRELRTREAARR